MDQTKHITEQQVLYLGRWVPKNSFRTFVYKDNESKLAKSYDEYSTLISSGLWFAERDQLPVDNVVDIKPKRGRKCLNQQ